MRYERSGWARATPEGSLKKGRHSASMWRPFTPLGTLVQQQQQCNGIDRWKSMASAYPSGKEAWLYVYTLIDSDPGHARLSAQCLASFELNSRCHNSDWTPPGRLRSSVHSTGLTLAASNAYFCVFCCCLFCIFCVCFLYCTFVKNAKKFHHYHRHSI